jgi:tetratricopeptide (TPR) repeat protein
MNIKRLILIFLLFTKVMLVSAQKDTRGDASETEFAISSKKVCVVIGSISRLTETEREKNIATSLISILKLSYTNPKYLWLHIADSEYGCNEKDPFRVNISITDLEQYIKFEFIIRKQDSIYREKYQVSGDSLVTGIDRISRSFAALISKKSLRNPDVIKIFYKEALTNGTLTDYKELINSTYLYLLKGEPSIFLSQNASTSDLIFESSVLKSPDDSLSYDLLINLTDNNGTELYAAKRRIMYIDILTELKDVFTEVSDFVSNYKSIKQAISTYTTPEKLISYVSTLPAAEIEKAISLTKRALYLDSLYLPAIAKLGELAFETNEYFLSEYYLEKAVKRESSNGVYNYLLAKTYYYNYSHDLALSYLDKADKCEIKDKDLRIKIYDLAATIHLNNLEYSAAIENLEKAFQLDQQNLSVWWGLSNVYYSRYVSKARTIEDSTDIQRALKYSIDGSRIFPKDSIFRRNASYILNIWGENIMNQMPNVSEKRRSLLPGLAREKFMQATNFQHYDRNVSAYSYNYLAYISAFDYYNDSLALVYSEKAFNLRPKDEWTYRLYAFLRKDSPDYYLQARGAILQAIAIDNNKVQSYNILGQIYTNMNLLDSAYATYVKILQMDNTKDFLESFIKVAVKLGRYNDCREHIQKYAAFNKTEQLWADCQFAYTYYAEKKYDKSFAALKEVLKKDKDNATAINYLDSLHGKGYKPALKELIALYEREFEFKKIDGYWALSIYYIDDQQFDKAITLLDKGLRQLSDANNQGYLFYLKSLVFYHKTMLAFEKKLPDEVTKLSHKTIEFANRSVSFLPRYEDPMTIIMVVYHEFLLDHDKSFEVSKKILDINPLSILNRTNYIDAAFSSGRYQLALEQCYALQNEYAKGKVKLSAGDLLNISFFAAASNFALKRTNEANVQFGKFATIYKGLPNNWVNDFLWNGVTKHLEDNKETFGKAYFSILSMMVSAINTKNRSEGLDLVLNSEESLRGD